jgi:hypothetical protein
MTQTGKLSFSVRASFPLAALLALVSLAGVLLPSVYARETPSWTAQGVGQDWVDLVVVAPTLLFAGLYARRGSRVARLLLGGLYVYTLYSFVIYSLGMHFNQLFFLYCAVFGLSFFATAATGIELAREDVRGWYPVRAPFKLSGILLIVLAVLFAALWLAEDLPAVLANKPPASLEEVGLLTNPVHVLDLSIVLPAFVLAGSALLRRMALGYVLAPIMLAFSVFMSLAIGGMMISLARQGLATSMTLSFVFIGVAAACAVVLALLLRGVPSPRRTTRA